MRRFGIIGTRISASCTPLIRGITTQQMNFAQSVETVLANIQFPVAVAEASSRSIGFFQDLVDRGGADGSKRSTESTTAQRIDGLRSNYTMDSERNTHTLALKPVLAPTTRSASEPSVEPFGALEPQSPTAPESLGKIGPESGRTDDRFRPTAPPASTDTASVPAIACTLEKPTSNADLGDNVELF